MSDYDAERQRFHDIEGAHQDALEEMRRIRDVERKETKAQLDTIHSYYLRTSYALVAVGIAFLVVVVGGLLLLSSQQREASAQTHRLDAVVVQQTHSRHNAVVASCRGRNALSRGILLFIRKVDPRDLGRAMGTFPIERSCNAYADRLGAR